LDFLDFFPPGKVSKKNFLIFFVFNNEFRLIMVIFVQIGIGDMFVSFQTGPGGCIEVGD